MSHYTVKTNKGKVIYSGNDLQQAREIMQQQNDKSYNRIKFMGSDHQDFSSASLEYTEVAVKDINEEYHNKIAAKLHTDDYIEGLKATTHAAFKRDNNISLVNQAINAIVASEIMKDTDSPITIY